MPGLLLLFSFRCVALLYVPIAIQQIEKARDEIKLQTPGNTKSSASSGDLAELIF